MDLTARAFALEYLADFGFCEYFTERFFGIKAFTPVLHSKGLNLVSDRDAY